MHSTPRIQLSSTHVSALITGDFRWTHQLNKFLVFPYPLASSFRLVTVGSLANRLQDTAGKRLKGQ